MPWHELTLSSSESLFTTAKLRWSPLVADEPDGAQVATLWGDPAFGPFGALVRVPTDPPDVYTLIRHGDDGSVTALSAIDVNRYCGSS